jgi:hypothetical protein
MSRALNTLLEGVIDYAGLFPPANFSMADAVAEYLALLNGPESWLVSRFVCPATRLDELADELESQKAEIGFGISVVGTGGQDAAAFAKGIVQDASNLAVFSSRCSDICSLEAYEVKAPPIEVKAALRALGPFRELDVFVEIPWDDSLHDNLHLLAESDWLGAKGRTGGLDASAFPSSEKLASFIQECLNLSVAFKLTAGLHHPVRHLDPEINVMSHGFLNVLLAACLTDEHELSRKEIVKILEETDPAAFTFTQDGAEWKGLQTTLDGIEDMRGIFVSYGSCSVSEPMEGLQALNLLEEVKG